MKKLPLYLALCVVIFATGCPKYKPQVDFENKGSFLGKLNKHIEGEQRRYKEAVNTGTPDSLAKAKVIRNELIENVLPYVDQAYIDFINDIAAGRDRTNFVADLVELGTSAAVGITNGERPLQILGIALTAFRGGRRSADLNFYKDQTTPVLITKMDGNRAKVRATILTREKDDVATYPIGAALSDIVDYYNAGTLVRAFTELQKDTANQTRQQENTVLELKGVTVTQEATVETRTRATNAFKILFALKKDLGDAAKKPAATLKLQAIVAALRQDTVVGGLLDDEGITADEQDGDVLYNALVTVRTTAAREHNDQVVTTINQAVIANGQ